MEINRFTEPSEWMFVQSQDMIADLETRHIDNLELVNQDSVWIKGFDWMKKDVDCFNCKINWGHQVKQWRGYGFTKWEYDQVSKSNKWCKTSQLKFRSATDSLIIY